MIVGYFEIKPLLYLLQRQVESTLEEDSHLSAGNRTIGAVVSTSTTRSDALRDKLFNESSSEPIGRDIGENGPRGSGGRVGRAMNATEEEDRHLSTGDGIVGAVVEGIGGATTSDASRIDGFDLSPGKAIKRYICKDLCFLKGPDITVGATGAGDPIL